MNKQDLISTLEDLKKTRRLSSEAEAIIKPFVGGMGEFKLSFLESNSTFSTRYDKRYNGGKTVIAQFPGGELECSVLFPPSENDWVEGLDKSEEFKAVLSVLELDGLYQRVVFGQSFEDEKIEEESIVEEVQKDISKENQPIPVVQEIVETVEDMETGGEIKIEPEEPKKNTSDSGENSKVDQPPIEKITEIPEEKEEKTTTRSRSKQKRFRISKSQPTSEKKEKPHHIYLNELRNKRYEFGEKSLSEAEKKLLEQDLIENSDSRNQQLEENRGVVAKGCRIVFGCIFGMIALNSCTKGGGVFGFILLSISIWLLSPFIKKQLKEK